LIPIIIGIVVLVIGSFICSIAEAALFSVSPNKIRQWVDEQRTGATTLLALRENMNRPITTIVILDNIIDISGGMILGAWVATVLGSEWLGLFSVIFTLLIIVFGEVVPKVLGERYAETLAPWVARPLNFMVWLVTPLAWFVEQVTKPMTRGKSNATTNEAEIKLLARIGHEEGQIEFDEAEMIQQIFRLNDLTAFDLMTPRVAITALSAKMTLTEAQEQIIISQHSRIIVTDKSIDDVVGIVLKTELFSEIITGRGDKRVADLIRPARFVPQTLSADKLLPLFQQTRQHLAIVVDDFGGIAGVITLEDVLEVITGEIVDETDLVVDLQAMARKQAEKFTKHNELQFSPKETP